MAGTSTHRSRQRARDRAPIADSCKRCQFEPPARSQAAEELRSLARLWATALQSPDATVHEAAAQLRDELHAVANRVGRLLETPGAPISPIRGQAFHRESVAALHTVRPVFIQRAVDRLVDLVDRLSPEQWELHGRSGDSSITIGELVAQPLHSSHRHLAVRRGAELELIEESGCRSTLAPTHRPALAISRMGVP